MTISHKKLPEERKRVDNRFINFPAIRRQTRADYDIFFRILVQVVRTYSLPVAPPAEVVRCGLDKENLCPQAYHGTSSQHR